METLQSVANKLEVGKVYETLNYDQFGTVRGNRHVKLTKVRKLVRSMKERVLLAPLIVNEKMQIVDGQHRFEAFKELGLPVPFIIAEGYELTEVQIFNQNMNNWTVQDMFKSKREMNAMNGSWPEYELIGQRMDENPHIPFNSALRIFAGTAARTRIEQGTIKYVGDVQVIEILEMLRELGHYIESVYSDKSVAATLILIERHDNGQIDNFDWTKFFSTLEKIKKKNIKNELKNPFPIKKGGAVDYYLRCFQDIYNENESKSTHKYITLVR